MRNGLAPSERLFTHGQRQLGAGDLAGGRATLTTVVAARPRDAQAKLFLAIAHAENGAPDEALRVLGEAMVLEPANAIFPTEKGVVHLDEGRPKEALEAFAHAASLAPKNALVESWTLLARWDQGDGAAAAQLATRTRDRAMRFQARVLLRTERCFLRNTRPQVGRDASPPPVRRNPDLWDRWFDAPRLRRRARALIAAEEFDAAASVLLQAREDFQGEELLDGMLASVLENATREMTEEVQEVESRMASGPQPPPRSLEVERRDAIFRLADALLQREMWTAAEIWLDHWHVSYRASNEPPSESHYAAALCIAAAEVACRRGRFDDALEWVTRGRRADPDRKELVRAEGLARIGRNEDRVARRLFDRFLDGSLYQAEDRLRELITGTKAFIST